MRVERPLRARLQVALIVAVLVFGSFNAVVVTRLTYKTLAAEQQRRVEFASALLASRLVEPLLFGDLVAASRLLDETRRLDSSLQSLQVLDPRGLELCASHKRPGDPGPMQVLTVPILKGELGELHLTFSLAPIRHQVSRMLAWLFAMIGAILVAGLGVSVLIARTVTKPLEKLIAFTQSWQLEGPLPPLDLHTRDEIDLLAQRFRQVAHKLQELHRESNRQTRAMAQVEHLATLGTLAAGVAHEINNPLAGIRAGLSRLLAKLPQDDQSQRYGRVLHEALDRIEKAVQNLLRFSRATEVHPRPTDISRVVEAACHLASAQLEKGQISVHLELPPNLPQAVADEAKLREVLLNLLLNACDATPPGGDIWVQARLQGNEVHITVADSGPGVPRELEQKIFLPFFTTKGEKGTGLGLAVSRAAMREMGGDLQLLRTEKGACFLLSLPQVAS